VIAFGILPPSLNHEWIGNRRRLEAGLKQMRDPAGEVGAQSLASSRRFQGARKPQATGPLMPS